ncbi:MAG: zinc-dependent alcohol dehydrogenase [Planctomycetota bacterium]|jgi:threonine dehydrogenase-like Zn-dependent dehydrogenase
MAKRKVATRDGSGRISVREEPLPPLEAGCVLVEVKASLVSPGTELGGIKRLRETADASGDPEPFGYGNAGVILELGDGVRGLEKGMSVACMGSGYALHASHAVVPRNLTVPIPSGVSFEEASFGHLAGTALQAIRRAEVTFGRAVAVFGLGIVGQLCCQIARASGGRVIAIDALPMRLERAASNGADRTVSFRAEDPVAAARELTCGRGVDIAILAFGGDADTAMKTALEMLKTAPDGHKMGVITIVGGAKFTARFPVSFGNVDVRASSRTGPGYHDEVWERGGDYPPVFVEWDTRRNIELLLDYIAEGRINVKSLITHRAQLDGAPEACEELIEHPERALGVILQP